MEQDIIYLNSKWVGVTKQTYVAFLDFLVRCEKDKRLISKEYIEKIKQSKPLRFNQGDAFFVREILNTPIPATEVGSQEEPIFSQMLETCKRKGKKKEKNNGQAKSS